MSWFLRIGWCLLFTGFLILTVLTVGKSQNNNVMDQQIPVCSTLEQLKSQEGKRVVLLGVYRHPGKTRLAQMEIMLKDGHTVVPDPGEKKMGIFSEANTGKKMMLTGTFYAGKLPERFETESRTDTPVLVAIEKAELVP